LATGLKGHSRAIAPAPCPESADRQGENGNSTRKEPTGARYGSRPAAVLVFLIRFTAAWVACMISVGIRNAMYVKQHSNQPLQLE